MPNILSQHLKLPLFKKPLFLPFKRLKPTSRSTLITPKKASPTPVKRISGISLRGSLLLISFVSIAFFAVILKKPSEKTTKSTTLEPALTVTSAHPTLQTWPVIIEAFGAIEPWQEASIGAEASLRVAAIYADVGDKVEKGQILAQLDQSTLKAKVAAAKAALAKVRAEYQSARLDKKRALQLKKNGAISEQEASRAIALASSTKAQVNAAKAELQANQIALAHTDIIAPDSGVISERNITLGAVPNYNEVLFHLIRQNRLEWRGALMAQDAQQVQAGQRVRLTLPSGKTASGFIRSISPSLNKKTRLTTVYADILPNGQQKHRIAKAGMYAKGEIMIKQIPAMTVPALSVVIRDGINYIFTLSPKSSFYLVHKQPVILGRRQKNQVEIVKGLDKKQSLVLAGAGFLDDGDIVRLAQDNHPLEKIP